MERSPALRGVRQFRQRLNILLAEDNAVNQRPAVRVLEKRGHAVVVAADDRFTIRILGKQPFDLLLMDSQMPDMGGLEATAIIIVDTP